MDYSYIMNKFAGKKTRIGVIGATRGYGHSLLVQSLKCQFIDLRVICSRHPEDGVAVLKEIGYPNPVAICESVEEIQAAPKDAILIVRDYNLVSECDIDSMVECTGNFTVGTGSVLQCLRKGINVHMVSKETDSICGAMFNQVAKENGAGYFLVNGDQPRNLLDLYFWAVLVGLEVVAAGKASEYDFVWDRETDMVSYLDGVSEDTHVPELGQHWKYKGPETLAARRKLLEKYTSVIAADLCEMSLVANTTDLRPATPSLDYPIARINELADIFIPEEDGGILKQTGVVDVFYNLHDSDEASFCGGEFVIVRCENETMWDLLAGKGHVVSRNKKYCCIYWPYHYLGLETPLSIVLGDFMGVGFHPEYRTRTILTGIAQRDLPAGTQLIVAGHHHTIDGVVPQLLMTKEGNENKAPFHLLNGAVLLHDLKAGDPITLDDVDLTGHETYQLYMDGLKLLEE